MQVSGGYWQDVPFKPPTTIEAGKDVAFPVQGFDTCIVKFTSQTEGVMSSNDEQYPLRLFSDAQPSTCDAVTPAAANVNVAVSEVQVDIIPGSDMSSDGVKTLLVSVKTPSADTRIPVDIVVVLDISGSMGAEATIQSAGGATESHGLTVLDVAKHGVKTIVQTMTEKDRCSLVTFNHGAKTVFGLTVMDDAGRKTALEKVDQIHQGGSTDIWKGLHGGLEALRVAYQPSRFCHSHIMLLTDGESSNKETIIPQLQKYKRSEAKSLPGSINTFGFGYNLDSRLLTQMADEGMGSYSFIPDAGFVGTVFVNTMSNLLVTFGVQAVLSLDFEDQKDARVREVRGTYPATTEDKLTILIGGLQYDQSRDIVIEVENVKSTGDVYLVANVQFSDVSRSQVSSAACAGNKARPSDIEAQFVARHMVRSAYVEGVRNAVNKAEEGRTEEKLGNAFEVIQSLSTLVAAENPDDDVFKALAEDINGQTNEAFSKLELYWKWGRHYAPSIMFAHKLQQCNNFKDPGVQHYGGALFQDCQDSADSAFNELPAPTPSRPPSSSGAHYAAPVNMAAYNNYYGG